MAKFTKKTANMLVGLLAWAKNLKFVGSGAAKVSTKADIGGMTVTIHVPEMIGKPGRGGIGGNAVLVRIYDAVAIGLYTGRIYPGGEITGTDDISKTDLGTLGSTDVLLYNLAEYLSDGDPALDPAAVDDVYPAWSAGMSSADGTPVYVTYVRQAEICSSPAGSGSILTLMGG
jgi:hypothetical protein